MGQIHYRLMAEMHERLQGHLDDPWTNANSKNSRASCYRLLGQFTRSIDLYEQALAIHRQIGYRQGEATALGNLGTSYAFLGQFTRSIELFERALAIARQIGYRQGETRHLGNLGHNYAALGQTARAIDLCEQALAIARQIGYRLAEAAYLVGLGQAYGDLGSRDQAATYLRQAVDIADAIGSAQLQSEARAYLARIRLLAGDLAAARQAISAARDHDYPAHRLELSLLSGIIWLRQDQPAAAAREFQAAISQARQQLEHSSGDYAALDTKALALCGLALTTDPGNAATAATVFQAARAIASADGITNRTLALFDALAAADQAGILAPTRPAAEGQSTTLRRVGE